MPSSSRPSGSVGRALAELDTLVMATEAELTAMGGDDLGDSLAVHESLFQQARGLTAVLTERRRGVERAQGTSVDQGVVASLEAESARLAADLAELDVERSVLAPLTEELAVAEAALAAERTAFESEWATGVPAPSGAAAEVRGELAALRAAVDRGRSERDRVLVRIEGLRTRVGALALEADALRDELSAAEQTERPLVDAIEDVERRRSLAVTACAEAEQEHRRVESERHAWEARVEALDLALDEARSRAGAQRLEGDRRGPRHVARPGRGGPGLGGGVRGGRR